RSPAMLDGPRVVKRSTLRSEGPIGSCAALHSPTKIAAAAIAPVEPNRRTRTPFLKVEVAIPALLRSFHRPRDGPAGYAIVRSCALPLGRPVRHRAGAGTMGRSWPRRSAGRRRCRRAFASVRLLCSPNQPMDFLDERRSGNRLFQDRVEARAKGLVLPLVVEIAADKDRRTGPACSAHVAEKVDGMRFRKDEIRHQARGLQRLDILGEALGTPVSAHVVALTDEDELK